MNAEEDQADVRRVRAGNVDAFEGIVRCWQRPLLNLAFRYCRDRDMAEEMFQEVFLRIFRKLDRYREKSAFSNWMFAVATRLFTSHVRRTLPRCIDVEELGRFPCRDDPSRTAQRRDRDEKVRRAVAALPDRYRDVIILFYFLDRDIAESAAVLGLSSGTFKSRLHRGRMLLERKIAALMPAYSSPKEARS